MTTLASRDSLVIAKGPVGAGLKISVVEFRGWVDALVGGGDGGASQENGENLHGDDDLVCAQGVRKWFSGSGERERDEWDLRMGMDPSSYSFDSTSPIGEVSTE